jgi:hypothetical protein
MQSANRIARRQSLHVRNDSRRAILRANTPRMWQSNQLCRLRRRFRGAPVFSQCRQGRQRRLRACRVIRHRNGYFAIDTRKVATIERRIASGDRSAQDDRRDRCGDVTAIIRSARRIELYHYHVLRLVGGKYPDE